MPKLEKSTDHSHKLISSENGQDTSAYKISGQSLHAFSGKCPETSPDGRTDRRTDGQTDGHAVKRLRLVGWTNGHMYRSKEGISGFGRTGGQTDGRTDGQPENIMPPAPKGGGITTKETPKLHITGFPWHRPVIRTVFCISNRNQCFHSYEFKNFSFDVRDLFICQWTKQDLKTARKWSVKTEHG